MRPVDSSSSTCGAASRYLPDTRESQRSAGSLTWASQSITGMTSLSSVTDTVDPPLDVGPAPAAGPNQTLALATVGQRLRRGQRAPRRLVGAARTSNRSLVRRGGQGYRLRDRVTR